MSEFLDPNQIYEALLRAGLRGEESIPNVVRITLLCPARTALIVAPVPNGSGFQTAEFIVPALHVSLTSDTVVPRLAPQLDATSTTHDTAIPTIVHARATSLTSSTSLTSPITSSATQAAPSESQSLLHDQGDNVVLSHDTSMPCSDSSPFDMPGPPDEYMPYTDSNMGEGVGDGLAAYAHVEWGEPLAHGCDDLYESDSELTDTRIRGDYPLTRDTSLIPGNLSSYYALAGSIDERTGLMTSEPSISAEVELSSWEDRPMESGT